MTQRYFCFNLLILYLLMNLCFYLQNEFFWINDKSEISICDKIPNILPLVNNELLGLKIYSNEY